MKYTQVVKRDVLSPEGLLQARIEETIECDSSEPDWEKWMAQSIFTENPEAFVEIESGAADLAANPDS